METKNDYRRQDDCFMQSAEKNQSINQSTQWIKKISPSLNQSTNQWTECSIRAQLLYQKMIPIQLLERGMEKKIWKKTPWFSNFPVTVTHTGRSRSMSDTDDKKKSPPIKTPFKPQKFVRLTSRLECSVKKSGERSLHVQSAASDWAIQCTPQRAV